MAEDEVGVACAGDTGGLDIVLGPDAERLRAHQSQVERHVDDADGDDDRGHPLPQHRDQHQRQREDREGLDDVGEARTSSSATGP